MSRTRRSTKGNQFVGRAGEPAAMSELSWLGYNVVTPPVDKGDDIFVVNNDTGQLWRIQVKTSSAHRQQKSIKYSFNSVKLDAIGKPTKPDLHFVFALRGALSRKQEDAIAEYENRPETKSWRFVIIERRVLNEYVETQNVGSPGEKGKNVRRFDIILHDDGSVKCSKVDWTHLLDKWRDWPDLRGSGGD